jgi:ribonuclease HI
MNSLATQGLVGITLLLGLFVVSVFVLWKAFRDGHVDIHVASILSAFLIAHFIGKALVFEDPTSYLYFFFALAFINSQVKSKGGAVLVDKKREITTLTTVGVCCVAFLIIFSTNINPARANKATLNTMRVLNQSPADAVTYFDQSQKIPTPHVDDIRNDVARGMAQVMQEHAQSGEKLEYETLYTAAYEGLKKNRILHPLDIRINIQMAQLDQLMAQVTQDSKYVVQAITLLEDAKDKSPKRQQVLYQLSALYAHVGDTDRAKELLEQSVEDNGKISEGWMRLAVLYNQMGEKEKVQELINLAKQKDVVFSDQQRQILDSFN